jgi:phosphohistidine phosphatase
MPHQLLLLRHAKSSWDDPTLADRKRPLAKRGRRAAELIGEHLRAAGVRPGLVICSPSRRTRETLELLSLDGPEIRLEDAVYEASQKELAAVVRGLPEAVHSVLLIGHNPSMGDLATWLSGQDRTEAAGRLREKFPTGALAVFETEKTWRDLAPGGTRLVSFQTPRDLAG